MYFLFFLSKKTNANLRLNLTVSLYKHVKEKEMGKHQSESEGRSFLISRNGLAPYTGRESEAASRDEDGSERTGGSPLVIILSLVIGMNTRHSRQRAACGTLMRKQCGIYYSSSRCCYQILLSNRSTMGGRVISE